MSRRDLLLKELGLTVWRQRAGHADSAAAPDNAPLPDAIIAATPVVVADETVMPPEPAQTIPDLPPPAEARQEAPVLRDWADLEQQVPACRRCSLNETRTRTALERGNRQAALMIVGEAPGEQEDRLGQPFVGPAGKLLDAMLTATGWDPERDVYIANVLKCRPPGNRNPQQAEMVACVDYLADQLRLVQPKLILCVGRIATQALLDSEQAISRLRGQVHHWHGVPLIVSYHPAYLLRNLPDKARAWQDLCFVRRTLAGLTAAG